MRWARREADGGVVRPRAERALQAESWNACCFSQHLGNFPSPKHKSDVAPGPHGASGLEAHTPAPRAPQPFPGPRSNAPLRAQSGRS